jgi:ferredoxin
MIAIGRHIELTCPTIERRTIAAGTFLLGLANHAMSLGYSRAEVTEYVEDDTEQERMIAIARQYFAAARCHFAGGCRGRLPGGARRNCRTVADWQAAPGGVEAGQTREPAGARESDLAPAGQPEGPHPMSDLRTIVIDGKEIEVDPAMTLIQACEQAGIEIPRFCYHERLSIAGNCRMCLVEVVGGPPKPAASCAMQVRICAPGRKVSRRWSRRTPPWSRRPARG